jgi:hypothetical protein
VADAAKIAADSQVIHGRSGWAPSTGYDTVRPTASSRINVVTSAELRICG